MKPDDLLNSEESGTIDIPKVIAHHNSMKAGAMDVEDMLRRIKPYLNVIKLAGEKYTQFPEGEEREKMLAVIWFNKEEIKQILSL